MRTKGHPIYFTFELDILFKSRLITDSETSTYEQILANYRLMKGTDKLSRAEEEIIKMLMERLAFGKTLIPNKIRFRKCFFLLRNMVKTCYQTLDTQKQAHMRVNPKSFFYGHEAISKLSDLKYSEMMRSIRTELTQGRPPRAGTT